MLELDYEVAIEQCKPRTFTLQRNHDNVPSESISDYFKNVVMIPLIDHLTVEIFDHPSILAWSCYCSIKNDFFSL